MGRQVLTLFVLVSGTVVIAQRPTLREMVIQTQADVNVTITATRVLRPCLSPNFLKERIMWSEPQSGSQSPF